MNIEPEKIGLKIASALLFNYGEISVNDIRSLPLFRNPNESENVIYSIIKNYNVEIYTKKVSSKPIPVWEEFIKLKNK